MENLELKVGKIETDNRFIVNWRFVLAKKDGQILFYGGIHKNLGERYHHSDVVQQNKLNPNDIVGGGYMSLVGDRLEIGDLSIAFGSVPNKAIKDFLPYILNELKEYYIKRVKIDMESPSISEIPVNRQIKFWNQFGYSFDEKSETIEVNN